MVVKAVIFDLDGTIIGFNLDYMAVRADVRGYLIRIGLPASILSMNESIFEMLGKAEIFLKNSGKGERVVGRVRNEVSAIAEKYELEAAKTTELLSGVVDTLEALKGMGLKLGLCTISSSKSANYILKRFGISRFFDAVTPRNKVKYVKPSTEHLEATLKALHVTPEEAMLVGDGGRDMQCAKELNVVGIGLTTGISPVRDLIALGASYLITSLGDLPTLVKTINKSRRRRRKPTTSVNRPYLDLR